MENTVAPRKFHKDHGDLSVRLDECFEHIPLDQSKASIRLIDVLPEFSACGRIQCTVSHSVIGASYTCLSYRWGEANDSHEIVLNGRVFRVRSNLHDFLQTAQRQASEAPQKIASPYWIDALSIDQDKTSERNHQVNQMGQIFHNAAAVHIWLGKMPSSMVDLVHIIRKGRGASHSEQTKVKENKDALTKYIFLSSYWERAWITQEIVLNRNVIVRMNGDSINFYDFICGVRALNYKHVIDFGGLRSTDHFSRLARRWREELKKASLISLLADFHDKQCENPRDRVYSLLSLSQEGHLLEVDYKISLIQLAQDVLKLCKPFVCICSVLKVLQALGLDEKSSYYDQDDSSEPHLPWLHFKVMKSRSLSMESQAHDDRPLTLPFEASALRDTCESVNPELVKMTLPDVPEFHTEETTSKEHPLFKSWGYGFANRNLWIYMAFPLLRWILPSGIELCRHARSTRTIPRAPEVGLPKMVPEPVEPMISRSPVGNHMPESGGIIAHGAAKGVATNVDYSRSEVGTPDQLDLSLMWLVEPNDSQSSSYELESPIIGDNLDSTTDIFSSYSHDKLAALLSRYEYVFEPESPDS